MNKRFLYSFFCFTFCSLTQINAQEQQLHIQFKNVVGKQALVMFEQTYNNPFNEPFTVNKFRYYIADLTLKGTDKKITVWKKPRLIDEADSASKQFFTPIPKFQITSIEFTIGVDSSHNVNGVQTEDLDPIKGMFWTWNTGYIYAKLEGQSDSSHAPSNYFSYHVGGYKTGENVLRKVVLTIPANNKQLLSTIVIEADILKWFNASNDIKISSSSLCHQPGDLAIKLANNYQYMFQITEVQ